MADGDWVLAAGIADAQFRFAIVDEGQFVAIDEAVANCSAFKVRAALTVPCWHD